MIRVRCLGVANVWTLASVIVDRSRVTVEVLVGAASVSKITDVLASAVAVKRVDVE